MEYLDKHKELHENITRAKKTLRKNQNKCIIIDKLDAIKHETLGTSPEGTVHNLENQI